MKKIISLLLVMLTVLTSVAFANVFTDLDTAHWAYEPIVEMSQKGILNGYPDGTFLPSKAITRAEFAKILVLTLDLKGSAPNNVFSDVKPDFWGYEYINVASNYLSGYTDGNEIKFLPNDSAVREDVAVAVVVATGLQNAEYSLDTLNKFSDKNEISENLKKYIAIAVENNLMRGNADGTFNPKGELTRAEVCKLMMNTVEELEKIAIADKVKNEKCTESNVLIGHKQDYTYKYKNLKMHKVYRSCDICDTSFYIDDEKHNFTYADYCGYCDYYRKSSVTLSKEKANIKVGEKTTLSVTLSKESNAQTDQITWSSNNLSVATVDNGVVLAVGTGTAIIKAQTDNFEVATCEVTVTAKELVETLYGDVNEDKEVNMQDSITLLEYLSDNSTTVLTGKGKENADLNVDGKINNTDVLILNQYLAGWDIELPAKGYIVYGDVNEDGVIDLEDLMMLSNYLVAKNITLTVQAKSNADVNNDGKVNGTDMSVLTSYIYGGSIDKLPAEDVTAYGDVNLDGCLNSKDITKLESYISGSELGKQAKKNADFNGDGKVNETDISSLKACIESDSTNPYIVPKLSPGTTVEAPKTLYGDVNEDAEIDIRDSVLLQRYLNQTNGATLTAQGRKNADLNLDGNVNKIDLLMLDRYLADWDVVLPTKGYIVYGDVNEDAEIDTRDSVLLQRYLNQTNGATLTAQGKKCADLNLDGNVNKIDLLMLDRYLADWEVVLPTKGYIVYGDVNEDAEIDTRDSVLLQRYLNQTNGATLTAQGKKCADLNLDGDVNKTDLIMLDRYLADWGIELPTKGYIIYGDANEDGEVDARDCLMIEKYAQNFEGTTLTKQGLKNSDVNLDGKVNGTDAAVISAVLADWDIVLPAKGITAYGDADLDGYITVKDLSEIDDYLEGTTKLSAQAKKNADFNGDGKIDKTDRTELKSYYGSQNGRTYISPLLEPNKK